MITDMFKNHDKKVSRRGDCDSTHRGLAVGYFPPLPTLFASFPFILTSQLLPGGKLVGQIIDEPFGYRLLTHFEIMPVPFTQ